MKKVWTMFTAILLSGMLIACGSSSDNPSARAIGFVEAMAAGDVDKITEFAPPEERAKPEFEQMIKLIAPKMKAAIEEEGGIKSLEVVKEEIEGDKATVVLKMTSGKGKVEENDMQMVKVDGIWYVVADGL